MLLSSTAKILGMALKTLLSFELLTEAVTEDILLLQSFLMSCLSIHRSC
jgi:hypothetical protein